MNNFFNFIFVIVFIASTLNSQQNEILPETYNVVWNNQSKNSSESMPCGGGSIGLNVWVENDELFFYMSKSDAFDENNGLNKLGRIKLDISPNPFTNSEFRQELILYDGYIKITSRKSNENTEIIIWVDVFKPIIHINFNSTIPRTLIATYESWRCETFKERPGENFQNSYKFAPFDTVYTFKDSISFEDNNVLFFHRNNEYTVFDANVKLQELEDIKNQLYNPIKYNTFGGLLISEGFIPDGNTKGKYINTDFKGWSLKSDKPVQKQNIEIYLHTEQTDTLDEWKKGLKKLISEAKCNFENSHNQTINW